MGLEPLQQQVVDAMDVTGEGPKAEQEIIINIPPPSLSWIPTDKAPVSSIMQLVSFNLGIHKDFLESLDR